MGTLGARTLALTSKKRCLLIRTAFTYAPEPEPEYAAQAKYPEILDNSKEATRVRSLNSEHDKIRVLESVEEKLFRMNMPRYYGWRVFKVDEAAPLGSLPLVKTITRTHLFAPSEKLPDSYLPSETAAAFLASKLRPDVERILSYEMRRPRRKFTPTREASEEKQRKRAITESIIKQINRTFINTLSASASHLSESEVDDKPRHEAFWFVGGLLPNHPIDKMEKFAKTRKFHDMAFQYIGDPVLTLRNNLPLEPLAPHSDAGRTDLEVPFFKYNPSRVGYHADRSRAVTLPGFWPGDPSEFGLLSFHSKDHLVGRYLSATDEEQADILHSQGILSSFAWLLAQACYQGFSPFQELTYPLVSQTVITDGQFWSFYSYQLNTVINHDKQSRENTLKNFCYSTPSLKLFDSIADDGAVVGFNEDVLKILIQFYLNTPKVREGIEMQPYLGKDIKKFADIEDTERRNWLEVRFKQLTSRAPLKFPIYEIYMWEQIYKRKFWTRVQDARRRPFETFEPHPFLRRLDDHGAWYVPRAVQPKWGPKRVVRWSKMYYP